MQIPKTAHTLAVTHAFNSFFSSLNRERSEILIGIKKRYRLPGDINSIQNQHENERKEIQIDDNFRGSPRLPMKTISNLNWF